MGKFKKILKSISTKVVVFIVLLVLPLNIIAIVESYRMIDSLLLQAENSVQSLIDTEISDLSSKMEKAQFLLNYFSTENPNFIKMRLSKEINYEYSSSKYKLYYSLKNTANITDGGDGYYYYIEKFDDCIVYDQKPTESSQLYKKIKRFVKDNRDKSENVGWHIYNLEGKRYIILIINMKGYTYGSWLNLDSIEEQLEEKIEYDSYNLYFTENISYNEESEWTIVTSQTKDIYLRMYINKSEITGNISSYNKALQIMVFVYLLIIPFLYVFLKFLLINPLKSLNYAHRQIKSGNQDYKITKRTKSIEYNEVYDSFNEMVDRINKLKIESYEKDIIKREIELRNLQLQIRPHFLLNTFNLIYTMAQKNKNSHVQEIIIYLSDYFRYIFKNEKQLELFNKELRLIKGYIKMVSIRYSSRIDIEYDIDTNVEHVRMPPLLIHNFIENSIKHGLKNNSKLHIILKGKIEKGKVHFLIEDNGKGIEKETLEKCEELLSSKNYITQTTNHVGLQNSLRRLKYFYGNEAKITLGSIKNKYTKVIIEFPYKKEE